MTAMRLTKEPGCWHLTWDNGHATACACPTGGYVTLYLHDDDLRRLRALVNDAMPIVDPEAATELTNPQEEFIEVVPYDAFGRGVRVLSKKEQEWLALHREMEAHPMRDLGGGVHATEPMTYPVVYTASTPVKSTPPSTEESVKAWDEIEDAFAGVAGR